MTSTHTNAFVHPRSVVDSDVIIGEGTKVWHFCHISRGARIGKNCTIGQNVFIDNGVQIGDGCKIQNNVRVYAGVTVGNYVFIGPSCVFTNDTFPSAVRPCEFRPTILHDYCSLGANSTIRCGVVIHSHSLVGAGSVVTKDVKKNTIVVGNPARFLKFIK